MQNNINPLLVTSSYNSNPDALSVFVLKLCDEDLEITAEFKQSISAFQGWMNEMYTYDPETYHPSLMHSVFVTLDGPCLRLDYPRNNIPRWAAFDELCYEKQFTHSRIFRLTGGKVSVPLIFAP